MQVFIFLLPFVVLGLLSVNQLIVNRGRTNTTLKRWVSVLAFFGFFFAAQSAHALSVQAAKYYQTYYNGGTGFTKYLSFTAVQYDLLYKPGAMCNSPNISCVSVISDESSYHDYNKEWWWTIDVDYYVSGSDVLRHTLLQGNRTWDCPRGTEWNITDWKYGSCKKNEVEPDCDCNKKNSPQVAVGKPIYPSTGVEKLTQTDYQSPRSTLQFTRVYRSDRNGWVNNYQMSAMNLLPAAQVDQRQTYRYPSYPGITATTGIFYSFPYITEGDNDYIIERGNERRLKFKSIQQFAPMTLDVDDKVTPVLDQNGKVVGWSVFNSLKGRTEKYGSDGLIQSMMSLTGQSTYFVYSDSNTPTNIAAQPGLLIQVNDDFGNSLRFTYNNLGQMITMTDSAQGVYTYAYDEASSIVVAGAPTVGNLTSVTYPDLSKRIYWYNEQDKTGNINLPFALTGITDEKGMRYATINYDASGKAISTELANGVDKYSINYSGNAIVTDPLNATKTYSFQQIFDVSKNTRVNQPAGSGSTSAASTYSYDANGNVNSKTDFNNNTTTYTYDLNSNLELTRVEASGTAQAKTISTQWLSTLRKPFKIFEPKKITTYVYQGQSDPFTGLTASCAPSGVTSPLLCKKVEQATTDANGSQSFSAVIDTTLASREWNYTYNSFGQVLTEISPQDKLSNVVGKTYVYYSTTTSSYHLGDLQAITNALNQVIRYNAYDANGRPLDITRADGAHLVLTYDLRGRLKTSKLDYDLTTYNYDLAGNLTSVVGPTGNTINYEYDAAHRLKAISDVFGNRMEYTLDNAGNTTAIVMRDSGGTLKYQQQKVYDALSRVKQVVDNKSNTTTYLYDANGNPTGVQDPKLQSTSNAFDALDQMKLTTDALNGQTNYSYDAAGRITQVTDPKNHSTIYNYNAFGDLTSQVSPDTGTTSFTYDAAGNRKSMTDARGVVVNYAYDVLNRLTSVTYPASPTENITFTYDSTANGSYGIGRLASVSTAVARNDYEYNHLGLITKKYSLVGSTLSATQYSYDAAGNLTGIIYPTGRSVTYVRDTSGRIQSISTQANLNAASQTVLSGITYLPFGPANSYNYGNGLSHTLSYDNDYRLNSIQVGGMLLRNYGFDANDNITSIADGLASSKNQTFNYDALNRLTTATGNYGNLNYTYDSVGNRLTETKNSTTLNYTLDTNSNRLLNISGTTPRSFAYDLAGNRITGTSETGVAQTFNYNKANRLTSVTVASTAVGTYTYNALGQRVSKVASGNVQELYHYDEAGQLIAVTDNAGLVKREYIYNGNSLASFTNTVATTSAVPNITAYANQATITGSAALATNQTGYTSPTGFIKFAGEGQVSWPVTINTAATYTTAVRYAMTGSNRAVDVYVDNVKKTSITFTATTNLNTWSTKSVSLALTAGSHTIAIKTKGQSAPNIDTLALSTTATQTTNVQTLYYVHNDHHNAPQLVTNQAQQVVWAADYQPFGKINLTTNTVEIYSRFPGQFADSETSLYYNLFRDYDPSLGRYIESDPIGLGGGINTYAYVSANPLSLVDPKGQNPAAIEACLNGGCEAMWAALTCIFSSRCEAAQISSSALSIPRTKKSNCDLFYRGDYAGKKEFFANMAGVDGLMLLQSEPSSLLMQQHLISSENSPFVSLTTDYRVAEYFAGKRGGDVYEIRLPKGKAIKNVYNTIKLPGTDIEENEWLVPLHVPAENVNNPMCDCEE